MQAIGVEFDQQHLLFLSRLVKAQRQRRAGIADVLQAADRLRPVDVAERDVVDGRKGRGRERLQRADVNFPHRLAAAGADGGQVAGGDDRQRQAEFVALRQRRGMHGGIVLLDGLLQR